MSCQRRKLRNLADERKVTSRRESCFLTSMSEHTSWEASVHVFSASENSTDANSTATFLKGDTIMRSYIPLLAVAFLALVLGCKEGTPGGPGAKTNAPSPSSSSTASRTTTVETPDGSTTTKVEVEKPVNTDSTDKPAAPGTDANPIAVDAENTFRLDAPNLATTIKQGETKVVTIGISRSKNFDQDVSLMFQDLPKGISIKPAEPIIKHDEKEVKINVTASADAAVNDFTIKMIGHPTSGKDATNEFSIKVQMP